MDSSDFEVKYNKDLKYLDILYLKSFLYDEFIHMKNSYKPDLMVNDRIIILYSSEDNSEDTYFNYKYFNLIIDRDWWYISCNTGMNLKKKENDKWFYFSTQFLTCNQKEYIEENYKVPEWVNDRHFHKYTSYPSKKCSYTKFTDILEVLTNKRILSIERFVNKSPGYIVVYFCYDNITFFDKAAKKIMEWFKHYYYKPNGKGFLKAKSSFKNLLKE